MELLEKLSHIQTEFHAKKSRYNSFAKYNFRSAEDILEGLKPFLLKYKVTVTIEENIISDFATPLIESTARITCCETGATQYATALVGVDLAQKGMQVPQAFGSASSYGKKYALGNLLLIDDTADSDATNTHGKGSSDSKKVSGKKKLTDSIISNMKSAVASGKEDVVRAKLN